MNLSPFIGAGTSIVIKGVEHISIQKEKNKYRKIYLQEIKNEIRDNLNLLRNRNNKGIKKKELILLLKDSAIRESVYVDLDYNKLAKKNTRVEAKHIKRKREEICIGWDCAVLTDKISEKITGLKNFILITEDMPLNTSALTQRSDNLYHQLLLLNKLIKEK